MQEKAKGEKKKIDCEKNFLPAGKSWRTLPTFLPRTFDMILTSSDSSPRARPLGFSANSSKSSQLTKFMDFFNSPSAVGCVVRSCCSFSALGGLIGCRVWWNSLLLILSKTMDASNPSTRSVAAVEPPMPWGVGQESASFSNIDSQCSEAVSMQKLLCV